VDAVHVVLDNMDGCEHLVDVVVVDEVMFVEFFAAGFYANFQVVMGSADELKMSEHVVVVVVGIVVVSGLDVFLDHIHPLSLQNKTI